MASQHLFIRLNSPPASLIRPLVSGSSVHFLSNSFDGEPHPRPHPTIDESSVNLVRGNDILLHIGIRRIENRIVLDTRRGNSWDQNLQVIDLRGAFPGPGASIKVNTVGDHYEISFSGHSRVFIYDKRILADATSVSYLSSAGTKPVFSNPLDVRVFYSAFVSLISFQ